MKLTSVELHADNSSDVIVLSFRDPKATNPYNVKGIVGLDAGDITPRTYGSSLNTKFYNMLLQKRDIVIKVGLNPQFSNGVSYSDLRDNLYKKISSSRSGKIQLQFKNGLEVVAAISGFISKLEAAHFDKTQEVQITINCDEPMLKALDPVSFNVNDFNPAKTIIFDDKSTAPHGFAFEMIILQNIPSLAFSDPNDYWSFELIPLGGFLTKDILHFSSEYNKYIYLVRNGLIIHLADVVMPGSVWPILFPENNVLAFNKPSSVAWFSVTHYPTYWGV